MKNKEKISKLALNLIAHRKSMGLTQSQVAEAIGTKRSTYAYYERDTMPSVEIIEKLAKIYGTTPSRIMFPEEAVAEESMWLNDEGGIEIPKIEFATLTAEEQDLLVKTRLLTEQQKLELLEKLNEILNSEE